MTVPPPPPLNSCIADLDDAPLLPAMGGLEAFKRRLRAGLQPNQLFDRPLVSRLMGSAYLAAAACSGQPSRKLSLLTKASRRLESPRLLRQGRRQLQPWLEPGRVEAWREQRIGWQRYFDGSFANVEKDRPLTTSLLLKEPGPGGEKGVLYCSFEFNWMRLLANHDLRALLKDYYLVGASSWSPSDHAVLASLCGLSEDPIFVGMSNFADAGQYNLYAPWIRPLPLLACDWVDPSDFKPLPHAQRSIDLLMVAHSAYWKRHHLLFQALRRMRSDLNVVLVGRTSHSRSERDVLDDARAFGVRQQLSFLSHLEIAEVMRHQCNAKVSLALSKREGSCVSVSEALFADSPVAMMHDAHVGARAYINPETGRLLRAGDMAHTLSEMLERSGEYRPRAWASQHISAPVSSAKLNAILREQAERHARPWTRDIAPLCWRYVPRYLDPNDAERLRPGVERLREDFGIELEHFESERKARLKNR